MAELAMESTARNPVLCNSGYNASEVFARQQKD